jgi:hypothetical protein
MLVSNGYVRIEKQRTRSRHCHYWLALMVQEKQLWQARAFFCDFEVVGLE